MSALRQTINIEARLRDHASKGLKDLGNTSENALGDKKGVAKHAMLAKVSLAAVGVAAVAAAGSMLRMARQVAQQNDELGKMADRIGASVEALSQYKHVAALSGVEFRTLTMGWQRMTRRISEAARGMGEARGALKELGLSAMALRRLSPEKQFEAIADAMQDVTNKGDKVRLAMKLFDSEGVALVQAMKGGAAGIREVRDEADKLGITVSKEMAEDAAAFNDALAAMEAATSGFALALTKDLIPVLTDFVTDINAASLALNSQTSKWDKFKVAVGGAGQVLKVLFGSGAQFSGSQRLQWDLPDPPKVPETVWFDEKGRAHDTVFKPGANIDVVSNREALASGDEELIYQAMTSPIFPKVKRAQRQGKILGEEFTLAVGQAVELNREQDVELTWLESGRQSAENYKGEFELILAEGFTGMLQGGDVSDAFKKFGTDVVDLAAAGMSEHLAEGIVDKVWESQAGRQAQLYAVLFADGVTEAFTEGKIGNVRLDVAAKKVGSKFTDVLGGVFENFKAPDSFMDAFGEAGSVGRGVAEGLTRAVTGGLMGAAVGTLIGDEINQASGAIGGALGNAFYGPVGGIIGSITGALAGKLPGVEDFISSAFGITDRRTKAVVQDLGTDIQAFGGLQGFFRRIGGFEGIRGERAEAIGSDEGGAALKRLIRLQVGATSDQAQAALQVIKLGGAYGGTGNVFAGRPEDYISSPMEILTILRRIGLDEKDLGRITWSRGQFDEAGNPDADETRPTGFDLDPDLINGEGEPPPPAGKPAGALGSISVSRARSALRDGRRAFDDYLAQQGVGPHSPVYNNLLNLLTSTNPGVEASARDWLVSSSGYDIVAGTGFIGRINRPTSILVGEHGTPENISIQPVGSGDGFMGGGRGPGGTVNHFNFTVNSLDPRGMRDALQGELGDQIKQMIRESSERGEEVVYSGGVVSPPSV